MEDSMRAATSILSMGLTIGTLAGCRITEAAPTLAALPGIKPPSGATGQPPREELAGRETP